MYLGWNFALFVPEDAARLPRAERGGNAASEAKRANLHGTHAIFCAEEDKKCFTSQCAKICWGLHWCTLITAIYISAMRLGKDCREISDSNLENSDGSLMTLAWFDKGTGEKRMGAIRGRAKKSLMRLFRKEVRNVWNFEVKMGLKKGYFLSLRHKNRVFALSLDYFF